MPDVTIPTGTYVYNVAATLTATGNVVRHGCGRSSRREFTARIDRLEPVPDHRRVSFGEAPKGVAQPITAWYPGGESMGHRFIYRGGL